MAEHTFDRGGQDDGTLTVRIFRSYGEDYVRTDLELPVIGLGLTADQARAYAADLITHADALDSMRRPEGLGGQAAPVEFTADEHGQPEPQWYWARPM